MSKLKKIGVVAGELGINPKTIRYYEEIKLIPSAQRNQGGHRIYGQDEIDRIAFILRARSLEFTLDDIKEILALHEDCEAPCLYVVELVQQRIRIIDAKINSLRQLRGELQDIYQTAQTMPPEKIAQKNCICHLTKNQELIAAEAS